MYNNNKKVKGLTFIEILIAVAILGLITILLVNILPLVFETYTSKLEESKISGNIQVILDTLTRDIRQGVEVIDIGNHGVGVQTLGYLSINFSDGENNTYSYTLYKGKYYFTVDGEILAGPIKEIKYEGYTLDGTYTNVPSNVRAISIMVVGEDDKRYTSYLVLRGEKAPELPKVYISEIMYEPPTTDKNGNNVSENIMEFVVISNDSSSSINLNGWKVNGYTITITRSATFTLSPGMKAVIGVNGANLQNRYNIRPGYIVLEVNSNFLGTEGRSLDNNRDTVVVRDNADKLIDQVNYSSSMGGKRQGNNYYSLYKISQNDWRNAPFLNYSRTNLNVYCFKAPIVITEIMYYPTIYGRTGLSYGNERNMEFIEIKNISNQSINIQNWRVIVSDNTITTLVLGNWNIPGGGYAVIGASGSQLNSAYNLVSGSTYVRTRRNGLAGRNRELNNTTYNVILYDNNGVIVDQVNYSNTWGGNRIISGFTYSHFSLVRKDENFPSNDPANWSSASTLNYSVNILLNRYDVYCTPGGP